MKSKTGFTLVELVVVLMLVTILASISAAGVLGWQSWAEEWKQEESARLLYLAAQRALTREESMGQLPQLRQRLSYYSVDPNVCGLTDAEGERLTGERIWGNREGSLSLLTAKKGSYETYLAGEASEEENLLFDLLDSQVYDKSILQDAAIAIELDAKQALVYSVFYSQTAEALTYGGSEGTIASRREAALAAQRISYYGVPRLCED